jgi:electron transfer flavoprotein alpha subunit
MATLVLGEHDNAQLDAAVSRAVRAASQLGAPVDVLIAGSACGAVAEAASRLAGIRQVVLVEHADLASPVAEQLTAAVLGLAADYDAFVAASTSMGKSVMPRVAALLDLPQVSDVTRVLDAQTFEHPIYAGNAIETVRSSEARLVLTIRTSAFEGAGEAAAAPVVAATVDLPVSRPLVVAETRDASDRPDLATAKVIVSGGRAFGSKQSFDDLLVPLASRLGAAIGASRAAVDAGYAANDLQVGQTGKIVAPDVYVAVGISGAIQHIAGMRDARIIIAINSDASAPIFEIADYGLVGDLFEILPDLLRRLE